MTNTGQSPLDRLLKPWGQLDVYFTHPSTGERIPIGWLVDCNATAAIAIREWANVVVTDYAGAYFVSPMVDTE